MSTKKKIKFKKPLWITAWLDTALEKEKEKYKSCPVVPDFVPGHEAAQGWGYVVAGYFLLEGSFKALILVRGVREVPTIHSLTTLFGMLDKNDKALLREYYSDYKATIGGKVGAFPYLSLDDFLENLDGDKNMHGDHIGSFDWRYFLIEEKRSREMPIVSVDYLHEIVFGCARILEHAINGRFDPASHIRSWRLRHNRMEKYSHWLTVRMNSEGWGEQGDRWELLWGPDYLDRHDLLLFKDEGRLHFFSKIPDDSGLPIVDMREEIESFDVEDGYRSIGVIRNNR